MFLNKNNVEIKKKEKLNNINSKEQNLDVSNDEDYSASRNLLVAELKKRGIFDFSGYIENEVTASTLVLFKALCKYYQIPFFEANKISTDEVYKEKLSEKEYTGWLKNAVDDYGLEWEDKWDQIEKRIQSCYDLSKIPTGTSIAASGVIMAEGETDLPAKFNKDIGGNIISYNGTDLESWGYIKYDLLSINTLNQIQYFKGVGFDWNDTKDPKVYDSICSGDLDFVFQLSGFVPREMCLKGKPRSIEDLAAISAINRPGPLNLNLNKTWIDVKNGTHEFTDPHDIAIEKILKKIYGSEHTGLLVYQEEVMSLCRDGSGFTLAESDEIRRAMGKKKQELMDSFKPQFVNDWKYDNIYTIGDKHYISGDIVELIDGTSITIEELYERVENGEQIEIKD